MPNAKYSVAAAQAFLHFGFLLHRAVPQAASTAASWSASDTASSAFLVHCQPLHKLPAYFLPVYCQQ